MKSFFYIAFGLILSITLGACSKKDIMSFKAQASVNFTGTTTEYSFLGNPSNEFIIEVPVRIIGDTVSYDRYFSAEVVVADTNTTAPKEQYTITGGVVKAGEFKGVLSVKLFNAVELSTRTNSIKVKLINTEDLKAGNIETSTFVIKWSNKIVIPAVWTYYRAYMCATSSTAVYKLIVEVTGMKTFTAAEYRAIGIAGSVAVGTKFGDYVKQWNKDHPNDHLKHDDGVRAGQDIIPVYYTTSKFD